MTSEIQHQSDGGVSIAPDPKAVNDFYQKLKQLCDNRPTVSVIYTLLALAYGLSKTFLAMDDASFMGFVAYAMDGCNDTFKDDYPAVKKQ